MMKPNRECEVTQEQFRRLLQTMEAGPGGAAEVIDVDGRTLVFDDRPEPDAESLLRPFIHQRGRITVDRFDGPESGRLANIWLSRHELLHAFPAPTGTMRLRAEPYEALYRILIDSVCLENTPALPNVDPVEIDRNDLRTKVWSVEAKRREACARIRQLLPEKLAEVAAALGAGQASLVNVAAAWDSPTRPQHGKLTWISTPSGLLTYEEQQRGLRNRHELDAEHPGWMWLRLIDRLPRADDLQYWQLEGENNGA